MAKIQVTPIDSEGGRKVLVNGVAVPDVADVSMYVRAPWEPDEVTITIKADSFQCVEKTEQA